MKVKTFTGTHREAVDKLVNDWLAVSKVQVVKTDVAFKTLRSRGWDAVAGQAMHRRAVAIAITVWYDDALSDLYSPGDVGLRSQRQQTASPPIDGQEAEASRYRVQAVVPSVECQRCEGGNLREPDTPIGSQFSNTAIGAALEIGGKVDNKKPWTLPSCWSNNSLSRGLPASDRRRCAELRTLDFTSHWIKFQSKDWTLD
jgi:hypothetical protein